MNCFICATTVGPFIAKYVFCEEEDKKTQKKQYATSVTLTFGITSYGFSSASTEACSDTNNIFTELARGVYLPPSTIPESPFATIEMLVSHLWRQYGFRLPDSVVIVDQAGKIALPQDIIYAGEGSAECLATLTVHDASLGLDLDSLPVDPSVTKTGVRYKEERPSAVNPLPDAPHCSIFDLRRATIPHADRDIRASSEVILCGSCSNLVRELE